MLRQPKTATYKFAGFTLLEMMLTVGLIALTATFVSISIGQSDNKLALLEAKRFVALVNLAQDESILTGRPIQLTVNASERQYQFTVLEESGIFAKKTDAADLLDELDKESSPLSDSFLKPRIIPQAVKIDFSLKPLERKKSQASKFVAKRVHEILNESILDKAGDIFDDEQDENTVLIEPNGIISPFSLSLSVDKFISKVELDRFGKAAIVEDKP